MVIQAVGKAVDSIFMIRDGREPLSLGYRDQNRAVFHQEVWSRSSKAALTAWCRGNGWEVLFFEGHTGAPRTGIVDAIIACITPADADALDIRLVQLKAGSGGLTAGEIARLKQAVVSLSSHWLLAAFDGEMLHFVPMIPSAPTKRRPNRGAFGV